MRIDQLLVQRGLAASRSQAARLVGEGVSWRALASAPWRKATKAGDDVPDAAELRQFAVEYAEELRHSARWTRDYNGELEQLLAQWQQVYGEQGQIRLYRPVGCDACKQTGYKGRVGLHELLIADEGIKQLIQSRARVSEIFAAAVEGGMRTLKMDGMEKVLLGLTDLKMVRAVCIK